MTELAYREATDESFLAEAEPLRREIIAHCYHMLGSVHDAEDLTQETYLRAWKAFDRFDHRSSLRTWMYRIATRVCLTALERRGRRPLPTGLGAPAADPVGALVSRPEVPWLEPLPDALVAGDGPADPASVVVARENVRIALVAALQHLTAQQRAVVLLREVLAWPASEVATALGLSVAAVNSTLQRARAHLARLDPDSARQLPVEDARSQDLLERYVDAFERYDVAQIVELLQADAIWEMPPFVGWYQGAPDIGRLIASQCPASGPGDMRLTPTSANGQPAFAVYMRGPDGVHRAFQLQQLALGPKGVAHVVCYFDTTLFAAFGLPSELSR